MSSSVIVTIVAVPVTKHAYDSKTNRSAHKYYFLNSLVTVPLVIVHDKIKFLKILAWKIKFVSVKNMYVYIYIIYTQLLLFVNTWVSRVGIKLHRLRKGKGSLPNENKLLLLPE